MAFDPALKFMESMTTKSKQSPVAPEGSMHFRPEKLRAPDKGESLEKYREYCASYEFYRLYLEGLKSRFWADAGKSLPDYKIEVCPAGSEDPVLLKKSKRDVLVVTALGGKKEPVPGKVAPTKPLSPEAKKARQKAKNLRKRLRERAKRRNQQIAVLNSKIRLAKARASYSRVRPEKKTKKGKKAEPSPAKAGETPVKGKKPEKKKKPKGPRGPPPSGGPPPPGGGGTSGSSKPPPGSKGPKEAPPKPPNRKERRWAIYGPPVPPVKEDRGRASSSSEEDVAQPVVEEEDSSSDSEIVPFVNPFAVSTPGMSSAFDRINVPTVTDAPITGSVMTRNLVVGMMADTLTDPKDSLGGWHGGYGAAGSGSFFEGKASSPEPEKVPDPPEKEVSTSAKKSAGKKPVRKK